ncbi:MAG: transcriptional regulatory protein ZraR [Methanoregula sp. PtaU1.Bin051]|nr:MAG: transcriptional regulatory protein ZraR [Methanoregula sp. PtaU1.Bin051]
MKRSIMVVEDDQPILDMMEILLKRLGYEPQLSNNGIAALAEIKRNPPSLILLDVMMMPINGWEFLDWLRADPATKDLPVVLFTAHPSVEATVAKLKDPNLGVLLKPVTFTELAKALEQYLGKDPATDR